ncbi:MAG: hypothetical protein IJO11_04185 [Alphaproteobacteria bacterium]|nr:hypothetical protein [Alphaproteobacteria bacterium]
MEQIIISNDAKQQLEKLAKDKGIGIDQLINEMLEELQPKDHLAKSIVSKKKSVNIPSIIRQQFDIQPGMTLYWDIEDGKIILRVGNG